MLIMITISTSNAIYLNKNYEVIWTSKYFFISLFRNTN